MFVRVTSLGYLHVDLDIIESDLIAHPFMNNVNKLCITFIACDDVLLKGPASKTLGKTFWSNLSTVFKITLLKIL